jgi:hypothetical protein
MTQAELFSVFANQKLYSTVTAFSDRHGVYVHVGDEMDTYPRPPRGVAVARWVRECVEHTVRSVTKHHRPGRAYGHGWTITFSTGYVYWGGRAYTRGAYQFSVWMPKEA